jgi:hypothetical protein
MILTSLTTTAAAQLDAAFRMGNSYSVDGTGEFLHLDLLLLGGNAVDAAAPLIHLLRAAAADGRRDQGWGSSASAFRAGRATEVRQSPFTTELDVFMMLDDLGTSTRSAVSGAYFLLWRC